MVKRMILKALYKNAVQDELDELLKTENEALEEISETRKQAYELFLKKADLEFSQYQQVKTRQNINTFWKFSIQVRPRLQKYKVEM